MGRGRMIIAIVFDLVIVKDRGRNSAVVYDVIAILRGCISVLIV
jgi:hypothetical protein